MKKISYVLLLSFALVFIACSKKDNEKREKTQTTQKQEKTLNIQNKKSNEITLTTVNGHKITLAKTDKGFKFSNANGKIVLVDFFATWCPPCKAEIPHLNNLQEEYKDKLEIIGVLIEPNKDNNELKDFINSFAINYTITNSPANMDFATAVGGVESIPFMIMYDKNGNYVTHYLGAIPQEMIDSDIQEALKK